MRNGAAVLLLAVGLGAACATGPNLPPKSGPEEVRLINPQVGQQAEEGYRTIGPVTAEAPLGTSTQELMRLLRSRAAELGADAVILRNIRQSVEGDVSARSAEEERLIAEGMAIYWPREEGTP